MKISQLKTFVQAVRTLPIVNSSPAIKNQIHSVGNDVLTILEQINSIAKKHAQETQDADLDAPNPFPEILSLEDQNNVVIQINNIRSKLAKLNQDLDSILKPKSTTPEANTSPNLTPAPSLSPEKITTLRQKMSAEFDQHLEFLHFLKLLPSKGPQKFKSKVTGKIYKLPEKQEVIEQWFTPEKLALIEDMEQQGLQPKLKIFPLLTLKELKAKIDAKQAILKVPGENEFNGLYIWEQIEEAKLIYSPTLVEAGPEGKTLIAEGGVNQAEWIDLNQGFIIGVVPTIPEVPVREDLQKDQNGEWLFNAQQAANLWEYAQSRGLNNLSYFELALLGVEAIKNGESIEKESFSVLLESSLPDFNQLSSGYFDKLGIDLIGRDSFDQEYGRLRGHFSVRGRRP